MIRYAERVLPFVLALWATAFVARADSWPGPVVDEVFSASRDYFVRVVPGESLGDTFGFASAKKGKYATAEFYRREADRSYRLTGTATLRNPIAPVSFFVANDGRLATVDNWHNRGYGAVVAIYCPDGKVTKAYSLADLFSAEEIEAFGHSVSSIQWHDGPVYINADQRTLYLMVRSGADLVFGLESGRYAFCETRDKHYACRDSNAERTWRPYAEVVPVR
ncbi:MAG: hypothetical protein SGI91_02260 [Alphaproteobacteria bacterium]|nr:hypothetical protein [Alphaproteobacteria bacterium]